MVVTGKEAELAVKNRLCGTSFQVPPPCLYSSILKSVLTRQGQSRSQPLKSHAVFNFLNTLLRASPVIRNYFKFSISS